ncbi:MAG: DUF1223 domain-containing protein [Alphaproteobacteria bacterium]|nr:DUF1223 domain-containing protein [Alphaproteobacteria bacterium]
MTRPIRTFAAGVTFLALCAGAAQAGGNHAPMPTPAGRPIVVELFTSQGCSSCPPADAYLGKLAKRGDVIALSLPVTYWDMLGWKDTLASEVFTKRQKAYAAMMGHGGVYTPQIVIDGVADVVGSRIPNVETAIAVRRGLLEGAAAVALAGANWRADVRIMADAGRAPREAGRAGNASAAMTMPPAPPAPPAPMAPLAPIHGLDPVVPVTVVQGPQEMRVDIGGPTYGGSNNAIIWMFHTRSAVSVEIDAGENEGRTLTYHNVVADLRPIGVWRGRPVTLTLPRAAMAGLPHDGLAVVVQQAGYGHVVGAAFVKRPDYYASR